MARATASPHCEGEGWSDLDTDCDDSDSTVHPGATEQCNEGDDDCDGVADEDLDLTTYYLDLDVDDFGDDGSTVQECSKPSGYAEEGGDCVDDPAGVEDIDGKVVLGREIFPDHADTWYDGVDQDCDGLNDFDADGDGFVWERLDKASSLPCADGP